MEQPASNILQVKSLGIDTYREHIIFIRSDSHICRSEGFTALTRLIVTYGDKNIIATLDMVSSDMLHHFEIGLSEMALKQLGVKNGDQVSIDCEI